MPKTQGQKAKDQIKKLKAGLDAGTITQAEADKQIQGYLDDAQSLVGTEHFGQATSIRQALFNQLGVGNDWKPGSAPTSGISGPSSTDPTGTTQQFYDADGNPTGAPGAGTGDGGFDWMQYMPDKGLQNLLTGKGGENILTAMNMQIGLEGRDNALDIMQQGFDDFQSDPLVQQLESSALGLLEDPDIIGDDLMQELLAQSDATLSRSYQGDQANLAGQIGGLNMDPNDPLAQSLQAAGRFRALQGQAQQTTNLQTQAAQLNRQGLENAMRMGMGTAGFIQGANQQYTNNLANLWNFNAAEGSISQGAALAAANNAPSPDSMSPWGQLGMNFLGEAAGSLTGTGGDLLYDALS